MKMSEQEKPNSSSNTSNQNTSTQKPEVPSNQVVTKGNRPIAPINKDITASLITNNINILNEINKNE
jgi:hypothetical protein